MVATTDLQAQSIYTDSAVGNLSVISPKWGPYVPHAPTGWTDVPDLSTAVYCRTGDNLEITVTADIQSSGIVLFRALVDGKIEGPFDAVAFRRADPAGAGGDGVRSFTFVRQNLSRGKHLIQIQWFTASGSTAQIAVRTLSVNSASPSWGTGRLAVAAAPTFSDNGVAKTTAAWEDIPNLATTLTTDQPTDMKITFSAEAGVNGGRFFARAVIDGQVVSDVLFDSVGGKARGGTRSFTFVKKSVPAGNHTVKMQWSAQDSGASIFVINRTLTAFASPSTALGGGLMAEAVEGPPVVLTSSAWVDVPNMKGTFTTSEPGANVQIAFSAQMNTRSGRMFLQALIDGQRAQPGDVLFVSKGEEMRAQSFVFVAKNILPGTHAVKIQVLMDGGATGQLANRSMTVLFKRRHGQDFAQPYASLKPRQGKVPMLVICFDNKDPNKPAMPTRAQINNQYRGDDGQGLPSVLGWYKQNTFGQFVPDLAILPAVADQANPSAWFVGKPERYFDLKTGQATNYVAQWIDAIKAADPQVDFHSYDRNGDNVISGDELIVVILRPGGTPYGTMRDVGVSVDGVSAPLGFRVLETYFSASDDHRLWNVGLIAHEAAHGALDAADMYSNFDTRPGVYSLMDWHGGATHLDPFHKLKSGFFKQIDVVEINTWMTKTVRLHAVESEGECIIIYDPSKKDKEYFIIENRWTGLAAAFFNYDQALPAGGIAVWHIVEDMSLANQFPRPGDPAVAMSDWGRRGVRFLGVLSSKAVFARELRWADGSSAKIKITAQSGPGESMDTTIAKLP